MVNLLLKKLVPAALVLALLAVLGLWFYGFLGIKMGWITAGDLNGMNSITRHGVNMAGGVSGALKNSVNNILP